MKILKNILKAIIAIIGMIAITVIIILLVDSQNTSYLKIDKSEPIAGNSYLITNVNVIPMTQDTVLLNKMVYLKEGIIDQIADSIELDGIPVLDAKGRFLTPGLIDMHVHVWDRYELGLYLSNGVTSIRNLWGMPMHLRIKEAVNDDEIFAPTFHTTGPKLTGLEFIGDDNLNITSPQEAKEKVASFKDRGYDFIKTYYGLDQDLFDAVLEQAKKSEMDVVAHPSQKVPFTYHLHPQIKSIEHAEEIVQQPLQFDLDTAKLQPIIDSIAQAQHTSYSPTLTVFNNIYQMMMNDSILDSYSLGYMNTLIKNTDSEKQFNRWYNARQHEKGVIERIKNQHEFHMTIVQELHEAGVNIICGTDGGIGVTLPGFSMHQELQFYKDAGLSNFEVMKTATVNAAKAHEVYKNLGTVEEGKIANLLLVDENPLLDLSNLEKPTYVFIQGRKLDRALLNSFNEKAINRKNLVASALRYAEYLLIEK